MPGDNETAPPAQTPPAPIYVMAQPVEVRKFYGDEGDQESSSGLQGGDAPCVGGSAEPFISPEAGHAEAERGQRYTAGDHLHVPPRRRLTL